MSAQSDAEVFANLDKQLNSHDVPLAQRFRALFTLKSLGGERAIEVIGRGEHPTPSLPTRWSSPSN